MSYYEPFESIHFCLVLNSNSESDNLMLFRFSYSIQFNSISFCHDYEEVGGIMTHGSVVAREYGIPAVVGIELKRPSDLAPLIKRMKENNFFGDYLNDKPDLFQYLI